MLQVTDDTAIDLTSPEPISQADKSRPPSLAVDQFNAEDVPTRPLLDVPIVVDFQGQPQPLPVIPEVEANVPTMSPPPRRMKQGSPNASKLNISSPIRRPSIERSTAYERPRPVPQTK